eukprot:3638591-Rhodomonas_salina.2
MREEEEQTHTHTHTRTFGVEPQGVAVAGEEEGRSVGDRVPEEQRPSALHDEVHARRGAGGRNEAVLARRALRERVRAPGRVGVFGALLTELQRHSIQAQVSAEVQISSESKCDSREEQSGESSEREKHEQRADTQRGAAEQPPRGESARRNSMQTARSRAESGERSEESGERREEGAERREREQGAERREGERAREESTASACTYSPAPHMPLKRYACHGPLCQARSISSLRVFADT